MRTGLSKHSITAQLLSKCARDPIVENVKIGGFQREI